jgi:hypothetical protein
VRDASAEKLFICPSCRWISAHRFPLWKQLPPSMRCPGCGAEAESTVAVGPDHPSLSAVQHARLRWLRSKDSTTALQKYLEGHRVAHISEFVVIASGGCS